MRHRLKYIKDKILEKRRGFTGLNHILFSLLILTIALFFKAPIISDMTTSWINIVLGVMVIAGASLMTDLDNPKYNGGSYAVYSLGLLGDIINIAMTSISSIAYLLTATKYDKRSPPKTQHRMLWHSPFVAPPLIVLLSFTIPNTESSLYSMGWPGLNYVFHVFIVTIALFLGIGFSVKKLKKFIPFYHLIMGLLPLTTVAIIALLPMSTLRFLTLLTAFGYLSHIPGDMMTKGGIPLWPIPTFHNGHMYMWWHYTLLGKLSLDTSNKLVMTICSVVFTTIILIMIYLLIMIR